MTSHVMPESVRARLVGLVRRGLCVMVTAAVLCTLCALGGCTSSQWERNFVGASAAPALPKGSEVQLREVPWDRVQAGLKELEAEQARSDVHPADWPAEKKADAKGKLLKTLQVGGDPSAVQIVGRSAFRTTTPLRPESDRELVEFAREVGADAVSWSRRLMGKADEIVQEPVTTFGTVYADRFGRRRGTSTYTQTSTTWVPIRVESDEYAYVAYFLRTQGR